MSTRCHCLTRNSVGTDRPAFCTNCEVFAVPGDITSRNCFRDRLSELKGRAREMDINKLLGRPSLKMTARYAHSSKQSRHRAVEALAQDRPEETLNRAVSGQR